MTIQQQLSLKNNGLLSQVLAGDKDKKEVRPPEFDIPEKEDGKKFEASIDDFAKIEMRVGEVISAEVVEGSDKLYKLAVDFGELKLEDDIEVKKLRTVFSGIRKYVQIEDIIGKQFAFVTNLAPRKIMGSYSEAMILAASDDESFALFDPTTKVKNGTQLG